MGRLVAEWGVKYQLWVPKEPVAKSTMKPPNSPRAYWIVQNDPKYKRLKETWAYQKFVAECAVGNIPDFCKDDPIKLSAIIKKSKHKTGDRKNIIAAIEDGLQFGGFIPDDRQVTTTGEIHMIFGAGENAGVLVELEIDPYAEDFEWLTGWLKTKKKAGEYRDRKGIAC